VVLAEVVEVLRDGERLPSSRGSEIKLSNLDL
jgi:hypothetical protein